MGVESIYEMPVNFPKQNIFKNIANFTTKEEYLSAVLLKYFNESIVGYSFWEFTFHMVLYMVDIVMF